MRRHIKKLLATARDGSETHRVRLTRQAAGSFSIKATSMVLAFTLGVVLARMLGAEGLGAYAYAMSWLAILSGPALAGIDRLLLREVSNYETNEEWGLLRGLLIWSFLSVLSLTAVLTVIALAVWSNVGYMLHAETRAALFAALLLLPLLAVLRLVGACQRGLRYVLLGQIPDAILRPFIAIVLATAATFALSQELTASAAVVIQAIAISLSLLLALAVMNRTLPADVRHAPTDRRGWIWCYAALPLAVVTSLQMLNEHLDVLILGSLHGEESTGIYAVAKRGSAFVAFPLMAVNAALGPTIARFYAVRDDERLQLAVSKSVRRAVAVSLPIAASLAIFGSQFLALFGPQFSQGYVPLLILVACQLGNVAAGSVALLLVITDHTRALLSATLVSLVVRAILLVWLTPKMGETGAAVSSGLGLLLFNAICGYAVIKNVRINPTFLGKLT